MTGKKGVKALIGNLAIFLRESPETVPISRKLDGVSLVHKICSFFNPSSPGLTHLHPEDQELVRSSIISHCEASALQNSTNSRSVEQDQHSDRRLFSIPQSSDCEESKGSNTALPRLLLPGCSSPHISTSDNGIFASSLTTLPPIESASPIIQQHASETPNESDPVALPSIVPSPPAELGRGKRRKSESKRLSFDTLPLISVSSTQVSNGREDATKNVMKKRRQNKRKQTKGESTQSKKGAIQSAEKKPKASSSPNSPAPTIPKDILGDSTPSPLQRCEKYQARIRSIYKMCGYTYKEQLDDIRTTVQREMERYCQSISSFANESSDNDNGDTLLGFWTNKNTKKHFPNLFFYR